MVQAKRKSAHFALKPFKQKQSSAVTVIGICRLRPTDKSGLGGEMPKKRGAGCQIPASAELNLIAGRKRGAAHTFDVHDIFIYMLA